VSAQGKKATRKALLIVLKIVISVGLLVFVVARNREAFADTLEHKPSILGLLAALALYLGGVALAFARWWVLVRALELPFRLREALRLGWIGLFFNMVIPGAIGGDFVKAAYIARAQHHKGRAVASVVIDRLVSLIGLFLLAAAGGLFAWGRFDRRVRPMVVAAWIALAVTLALLALSFSIHPRGPLARRLSRRARGERLIGELHATGVAYRRRLGWVGLATLMACATYLAHVAAFALVYRSVFPDDPGPGAPGYLSLVPLVLFSTAIPLPFAGLGAAENVSAVLFRTLGYGGGAVAMIGFRLLQLVGAGLGIWVYLTHRAEVAPVAPHAPHVEGPAREGAPPITATR
jgi:uncharacterized membrane protein YbhN (UPF0104 family)